jgi:hypothetical protein
MDLKNRKTELEKVNKMFDKIWLIIQIGLTHREIMLTFPLCKN